MGKAQYKKKTARHNPLSRVSDAHLGSGRAEGKANPSKERHMLPVLQKLSSPEAADRVWACAAICNLIQNDAATRRLFQGRNVVGALIERLSDSVDDVVVEASGALRNLAIDGGHELCSEMYNKGIMPHLTALMGKISSTIDSILSNAEKELSDSDLEARQHLLALTENVIALIWSLAEATHKTLAAVNAAGVEGLLVKVLGGRDIVGAGDNPPFTRALLAYPNSLSVLVAIARENHEVAEADAKGKGKAKDADDDEVGDGRALLTRVLVCGTLRNTVEPGSKADAGVGIGALTNEVVLPLVNSLLDVDLPNVAQKVAELVEQVPKDEALLPGKNMKTDYRSPAERQLIRLERMLNTVTAALEVLTSICAGLEDAEEAMDEDAMVEENEEEPLADEDLIALGRNPASSASTPAVPLVRTAATLPVLLGLQLPRRLLALAQLTPLSLLPLGSEPSIHPPTTAALSALHLIALEAANNLLLCTATAIAGGDSSLASLLTPGLWETLFALIAAVGANTDQSTLQARGQEMRLELIEAALGCAWGVAKASPPNATEEQIQTILTAISLISAQSASRAIDTLATLAARPNVSVEENRAISAWLIERLVGGASAEMTVALINAIIDIYADEERAYDPVFTSGGYAQALAGIVGRVRTETRKVDRRKDFVLRARAEEAYENLVAFIKYRRSLGR